MLLQDGIANRYVQRDYLLTVGWIWDLIKVMELQGFSFIWILFEILMNYDFCCPVIRIKFILNPTRKKE